MTRLFFWHNMGTGWQWGRHDWASVYIKSNIYQTSPAWPKTELSEDKATPCKSADNTASGVDLLAGIPVLLLAQAFLFLHPLPDEWTGLLRQHRLGAPVPWTNITKSMVVFIWALPGIGVFQCQHGTFFVLYCILRPAISTSGHQVPSMSIHWR